MPSFHITYSEDVNEDIIINLKKNKFKCKKVNSNDKNREKKILQSNVYITKYLDIPKFKTLNKNLKLIHLLTSDHSKIDKKFAKKKGIIVLDNLGSNSTSVAEHTIGLILNIYRNINEQNNLMKEGKWVNMKNNNIELENKKIGIIGFGKIGSKVGKIAKSFNMQVYFNDISKKIVKKYSKIYNYKNKNFIYKNSDIISLHVDLNKTTKFLIKKKNLNLMKKNAVLINTSRGDVVKENELKHHLIHNSGFKAGIDVFQNEKKIDLKLVNLKNLLSTPHSGPSKETRFKLITHILQNIRYLKSGKINRLKDISLNY